MAGNLKQSSVDMTQGSIVGHLIRFSLPLLAGNLFQQLYNLVDTWVVGNYVSNEAFSAVGTVNPIINTLIGFFLGLSSGAGVVISQYYGAKRDESVRDTVHTSLIMTFVLSVLFTVVGIAMVPAMLRMINMPDEVIPDATTYLTIYFAGVTGLLFYNMGTGIMRAVGDSKRPFYYLLVSAVLNIVLDLLFVLAFGMQVEGVAWATVISQAVSALLAWYRLIRVPSCVQVHFSKMKFSMPIFKQIVQVGLPASLQMAVTSFSNVFVQSYINYFKADCMSGWTAYNKIDSLIFLPMQSLGLAATTFVGQNLGCGNAKRAKKGSDLALWLAFLMTAILTVPVIIYAPEIVAVFNKKAEVVEYGTLFLHYLSPFYILCCVNQVYSGSLRGAGDAKAPMIIMLCSFVVFRQIYLFIMANFISNTILPIAMGYPAGWVICSLWTFIYYRKTDLMKTKLT